MKFIALLFALFTVAGCASDPSATRSDTSAEDVTIPDTSGTASACACERGEQGPQGLPGKTGPAGAPGAQGEPGKQGMMGTPGSDGANGAKGATGASGAQGAQGETGSTGPQGAKGNTGAAGATGPQGAKGDPGTPGAAGPTGPMGAGPIEKEDIKIVTVSAQAVANQTTFVEAFCASGDIGIGGGCETTYGALADPVQAWPGKNRPKSSFSQGWECSTRNPNTNPINLTAYAICYSP